MGNRNLPPRCRKNVVDLDALDIGDHCDWPKGPDRQISLSGVFSGFSEVEQRHSHDMPNVRLRRFKPWGDRLGLTHCLAALAAPFLNRSAPWLYMMIKSCSVLACLLTLPALAIAQTGSPADSSGLALGLGVGISESPYAGEGTKITPLPLIHYEGERFFVRGLTAGAHLMHDESFELNVIASLRTDGIDAKDFGRKELARNGINRDLLEDRDSGVDMGLSASLRGAAGKLQLTAKSDVSGASEGYELSARYGYEFSIGRGSLEPTIAVSHLSKDSANYYYGTLKDEVARGVVDYKPGASTIPELGLTYVHPIGDNWRFVSSVQYKFLPGDITDSPLLEDDTSGAGSVMFGISRGF